MALWFGKDEALRTQISVLGVIAGNDGAAVLSVDGGPPSAWRLGDEIAPGIALRGIEAGAVIVKQGGRSSRLPAPHAASARRDHAGALTTYCCHISCPQFPSSNSDRSCKVRQSARGPARQRGSP